jgi:hypothetical protein
MSDQATRGADLLSDLIYGSRMTTCASTASSLNLRRANARRPLTHSQAEWAGLAF